MRKYVFIFFLFLLVTIKSQTFIEEPIYFIGMDGMNIYKQSNDTLYNYTSYTVKPFAIELKKNKKFIRMHYRIWENKNLEDSYFALKLERLDTLQMTSDKFPDDRFQIWIYKKLDKDEFISLAQITELNNEQMLSYQLDLVDYKNYVGFSYYSLSKVKEFSKLKLLKTNEDLDLVKKEFELNSAKYKTIANEYIEKCELPDMYGQSLYATLYNMVYLKLGYCPVGASIVINNILNSSIIPVEKKEGMVNEFYEQLISK